MSFIKAPHGSSEGGDFRRGQGIGDSENFVNKWRCEYKKGRLPESLSIALHVKPSINGPEKSPPPLPEGDLNLKSTGELRHSPTAGSGLPLTCPQTSANGLEREKVQRGLVPRPANEQEASSS